jgi:hypothetical protein
MLIYYYPLRKNEISFPFMELYVANILHKYFVYIALLPEDGQVSQNIA